ncbi:hypothetical protein [Deinococcus aquiradiocola]|uniref:Uncharacterized protein n=1 Tax=Deinococcus aquiradiocola TaxID=393059 RepID=A0A917UUJ5_9DEIO|nr:hypothetical protein [Deinococcus aquiradiocola]GGJ87067.1 hypothetical protein GCM10008939_33880 [Deinococcus aquiradiocola]
MNQNQQPQMKKFAIRKTETIKTTAAAYGGTCGPIPPLPPIWF